MATIFGHGLVAYTATKIVDSKSNKLLLFLAVVSAMLPDIDVIGFNFGINYSHPLGHRGFTHSIMFAVLWACIVALVFGKKRKLIFWLVIFLSTLSHGVLDALTTGGKGVGFFIPFDNARYFFPWRLIKVSPIGIRNFFSEWGLNVILNELKYIVLPCVIILMVLKTVKGRNYND